MIMPTIYPSADCIFCAATAPSFPLVFDLYIIPNLSPLDFHNANMSSPELLVAKQDPPPPSDLEFGDFLMIPAPELPDLFRLSPLPDTSDAIVRPRTTEEGEGEGDSEDHPTFTDVACASDQNPLRLGVECDDAPIIDDQDEHDHGGDGFRTPTLTESRIPQPKQCPPAPRKLRPVAPRKSTPKARRRLDFDPWEELEMFMASPLPSCTDIGGGDDIHDRVRKIKKARTDGHGIE